MKVSDLDVESLVELIRNCVRAELNQHQRIREVLGVVERSDERRKTDLINDTLFIIGQLKQALSDWRTKRARKEIPPWENRKKS